MAQRDDQADNESTSNYPNSILDAALLQQKKQGAVNQYRAEMQMADDGGHAQFCV